MPIKKPTRLIALVVLFIAVFPVGSRPRPFLASSAPSPQTQTSGPTWVLLPAPDTPWEDNFGYTTAMDGDFLVASVPGMALPGGQPGWCRPRLPAPGEAWSEQGRFASAIYIYQGQGDIWPDQLKVIVDLGLGEFEAWPLAIDDSTTIRGSPGEWSILPMYSRFSNAKSVESAMT